MANDLSNISGNGQASAATGSLQGSVSTATAAPGSGAGYGGGQQPQPQGGGGQATWSMPKELQGKAPEELGRMYSELQGQMGRHTEELGALRKFREEASRFINDWDPMLRQVAYRPDLLAQVLENRAQQQYRQGDPQGARETQAQATQVRRWAEAVMPDEQEQWIQQAIASHLGQYNNTLTQQLQARLSGLENYMSRFGEYALRAMDARASNPNLTIDQILQGAVVAAQRPADPISMAVQQLTAPQQFNTWLQNHDAETRKQWEEANKNQQMTAFVGAGMPSHPLRSSIPPPQSSGQSPMGNGMSLPPSGFSRTSLQNQQMAQAKQNAIGKIASFMQAQSQG